MSTLWIGTSWKMTKTLDEARAWSEGLREALGGDAAQAPAGVQPFVIPSFTATTTVRGILGEDSPVLLGVQNAHWEDAGAWTGEVSVPQAKDAGAQIVEIGHSERREHFGETVETTRLKVAAALRHGLTPLLCIGESADVKEAGGSSEFILDQARGALEGLSVEELSRVVIAYEPIWAIGEGPARHRRGARRALRRPGRGVHREGHRPALRRLREPRQRCRSARDRARHRPVRRPYRLGARRLPRAAAHRRGPHRRLKGHCAARARCARRRRAAC